MSWNDPERDDKGKDKDPWGKNSEGPPDLDEALRQFQHRLRKIFGGGEGGGFTYQTKKGPGRTGMFGFGLIAFILIAIYIASGIYIVEPPEKAVVTRFGKYVTTVGPGPHWVAPLIESRKIVDVEKIHTEQYPYRDSSVDMITKDNNIASVEVAVQYRIENPKDYLFNLPDPQNTLRLGLRSALRSAVGKVTLDELMTEGRTQTSQFIKEHLQTILKDYQSGIKITRANLRKTTVPKGDVQDAYDDANAARQDQEKFINEATAEKIKQINVAEGEARAIINEAQAYKESKILEAQGNTQRFLEVVPEYKLAPEITKERLFIESMQEVYANNPKIMIDVDSGNNLVYIPLDKIVGSSDKKQPNLDAFPTQRRPTMSDGHENKYSDQTPTKTYSRPSYSNTSRPTRGSAS